MEGFQVLVSRKSEREFMNKAVEETKINDILQAAMNAPSAMNKQPWFFIVVNDRKLLDKMASELPYAKMAKTAPLGIVVCGDSDKTLSGVSKSFWIQDTSAATMNILNACQALGLGAVWTGIHPSKQKKTVVKEILNLPDNLIPLCLIPIGYVKKLNEVNKSRYREANIHYNKF